MCMSQKTIVAVEHVSDTNVYTIIVMEYMAGGSLADRLVAEKGNRFSEGICQMLAYQLLVALEYLHFKNIIHRVKLADFGLSKLVSQSRVAVTECGTKKFAAPEVLSSHRQAYTSKVDVWSLGATLYLW
jgi:serine/threonine protein kinase